MTIRVRWACVAVALGACAAYAVLAPAAPAPWGPVEDGPLRFQPARVDLGDVPVGESRAADVRVENVSKVPVIIRDVKVNCGCVKAEVARGSLLPGQTRILRIAYSAISGGQTQRVGVQLLLDHYAYPQASLAVHARVRQEVGVEPTVLHFGTLRPGQTRTLEAVVRHADRRPFEVRPIVHSNFEFEWTPLEEGRKDAWRVRVTAKAPGSGWLTEGARIMTDDTRAVRAVLHLVVGTERAVLAEPSLVTAPRDGAFRVTLRRLTPGEVKVTRVREGRGVPVEFDPEAEGRIRIRIVGEVPPEAPFGEFLIETDVEAEPVPVRYRIDEERR